MTREDAESQEGERIGFQWGRIRSMVTLREQLLYFFLKGGKKLPKGHLPGFGWEKIAVRG
jgi:hypothetical protein